MAGITEAGREMRGRFSSEVLYELRNDISVERVIGELLRIPIKMREEIFRFLCPVCEEFQTAVNQRTNLGRCFRCEQNFNTIDLVCLVREIGFRDAVRVLQQFKLRSRVSTDKTAHGTIDTRMPTKVAAVLKTSLVGNSLVKS